MARLHEYQGKVILAANGFKIPRGRAVSTADEFRLRVRRARHRKIHCPGRAQVARFRDNRGFGAEGCKTADQNGEERRAAKECSNTHGM